MSFFGDLFDFNGDDKITGLEWLCDFSAFFIVVFLIFFYYTILSSKQIGRAYEKR
mgnify:CR=1 FL=1